MSDTKRIVGQVAMPDIDLTLEVFKASGTDEQKQPVFIAPVDLLPNDTILFNPITKNVEMVTREGVTVYP